MPSISFQPVLRDVKDLLKSDFYEIPRFQRPYSWSSENLDDFWRDVVLDNEEGYFIGPMVAYKLRGDVYGIVDGQQRITSITLALCVLRDLFLSVQANKFADGLQKYIEREDDDMVKHFVLKSDAAGNYLRSQVQAKPPRASQEPKNEEQRAIRKAFDEIQGWLNQQLEGLSIEAPDEAALSDAALRLREIRDKILALQIIWIELDSEDDAYVIFETLNSRGKDLEAVDLLKNLLLSAIRAENGDLDSARVQWATMRGTLATAGGGVNPNKFILHWWLSKREYTAERKLFRLLKKQFDRKTAAALLADLAQDAELYARVANPAGWQCLPFERPLKDSLIALNTFGVRQPRPTILAAFRALKESKIKFAKLRALVRAMESYHYITTAIVGVSSTGGISMMYASHAREISAATTSTAVHKAIDSLITKLGKGISSRETFVSEFPRALRYSEDATDSKRLVQYTLRKLHDAASSGWAIDHAKCNIEHIAPQSEPGAWRAEIGNLLWVDSELNTQLGTKPFGEKKALLDNKKQAYSVSDILAADTWDEAQVAARSRRLAELAYDSVWKVQ